jgi:glutaredoxin
MPQVIDVYWRAGCSSCLRMKEFIAASGFTFRSIDVEADPAARERLSAQGMRAPVAGIGDRLVPGGSLADVAELIGVEYTEPAILPADELMSRYDLNLDAGLRYVRQMPQAALDYKLPNRDRPMFDVACQVASVARSFLAAYYDDAHTKLFYTTPDDVRTKEDLIARAEETRALMHAWWEDDGFDDPLDRVTQTHWGYPTLHQVLEREVWHTTQHVRQLMYVLRDEFGIEPDGPLTPSQLDGLPLPTAIHE